MPCEISMAKYKSIRGSNDTMKQFFDNVFNLHDLQLSGELKFDVKYNYHINKYNKTTPLEEIRAICDPFPVIIKQTMQRDGYIGADLRGKQLKRKTKCPHSMRRLTVTVDGKMFPCCMVGVKEPNDIRLPHESARIKFAKDYAKSKGLDFNSCKNCTSKEIYK